jgi:uncharacterized protein (UPF0248 family)
MTERFVRDTLLKRKWSDSDNGLQELSIVYVSRGSPGDISRFQGSEIDHIGRSFVELIGGTMIPYHRIVEVYKGKDLIWSRNSNQEP